MTLSKDNLREIARDLAPMLLEEMRVLAAPKSEYVKGHVAIGRFLDVSAKTIRRRVASKKIPVCGYEEIRHRGKIVFVPICRIADLRASQEQLLPRKTA